MNWVVIVICDSSQWSDIIGNGAYGRGDQGRSANRQRDKKSNPGSETRHVAKYPKNPGPALRVCEGRTDVHPNVSSIDTRPGCVNDQIGNFPDRDRSLFPAISVASTDILRENAPNRFNASEPFARRGCLNGNTGLQDGPIWPLLRFSAALSVETRLGRGGLKRPSGQDQSVSP